MLEWFTTIPGILVICGVILLVIAIILFIVSAKKDKKQTTTMEPVNNNIESVGDMQTTPTVEPVQETVTPVIEPIVSDVTADVNQPTMNINTESVVNVNQPAVEDSINAEGVVISNEEMVVPQEVVDFKPATEPVNMVSEEPKENTTIYGGQEPVFNFTAAEEKPVTIYGGNDPLEATQKLQPIEEKHMPYGLEYPEVKIVEPSVEQPVIEPVQEVVTPIATVDFNTVSQPEVINIPVTDDIAVKPVIEPVVEPAVENIQPATEENSEPVVEEL